MCWVFFPLVIGPTGPAGEPGNPGVDGLSGSNGEKGSPGLTGREGDPGKGKHDSFLMNLKYLGFVVFTLIYTLIKLLTE